jgi:hypothetical protein
MRRRSLIGVGILVLGSALGWGAWAIAQQPSAIRPEPVRPQVTVPAVPNIGAVAPSQVPSELANAPQGIVFIGYRGAYHIIGAGHEGHAMFRDANNQFWAKTLAYYGTSNGYWIVSVNGSPDTFLAFQTTQESSDAPFFKVLIHTPAMVGYSAWDEATRGNVQ